MLPKRSKQKELKSQSGQKVSKIYPMLHNASQASFSDKEGFLDIKNSTAASDDKNVHHVQDHQSENLEKYKLNVKPQEEDLFVRDSLSNDFVKLEKQHQDMNAASMDDEEDASTVVAEDSLSFTKQTNSDPARDTLRTLSHDDSSPPDSDPYAHLRYNPGWRSEQVLSSGGKEGNHLLENSKTFMYNNSEDIPNPNYSEDGAITVYNKELLQAKDSPVRLSADPSKLLLLNEKYESEFNRLLEQEQQWKVEEESSSVSSSFDQNLNTYHQTSSKSKLKPPLSYKKPSAEADNNRGEKKIEVSTRKKPPAPHKNNTKEKKSSTYFPSPPKATKSNRDYIELNKARLGRKSNSASYLEMYSKKNRILDEARLSPRRPLSDVRQHQKRAEKISDYTGAISDESTLEPEEIWKIQADRLKQAKEANSKPHDRKPIREAGHRDVTRPSLSPHRLFNTSPQGGLPKMTSPSRDRSPSKVTSSSRDLSPRTKSDFTKHPAFTPFSQRDELGWSQGSGYRTEMDPYHETEPKPYRQTEQFREIDSKAQYDSSFNASSFSSSQAQYPHLSTGNPPYQAHLPFHQVHMEDFRNHHPSPMMQAYHQRFAPPHAVHSGDMLQFHHGFNPYPTNDFSHHPHFNQLNPTQVTPHVSVNPYHPNHPPHQTDHHHSMSESDASQFNSIPRLPPIPTKPERDQVVEAVAKQSFSDSDVAAKGSYLKQHEKKKQKPAYKRYTLDDYKSLKRDINMGGLGPDLLTAKLKMEKADRVKKYSEFIRQQHKTNVVKIHDNSSAEDLDTGPGDDSFSESRQRFTLGDSEKKKLERQERRKKALDYAKQVPKPKAVVAPITASNRARDSSRDENLDESDQTLEWDLLKSLRDRHEKEKAIVAEMTSPRKVM